MLTSELWNRWCVPQPLGCVWFHLLCLVSVTFMCTQVSLLACSLWITHSNHYPQTITNGRVFCRSVQYSLPKIISYPVLLGINKQELCAVKADRLSKCLLSLELATHPIILKIILCTETLEMESLNFHFAITLFTVIFKKMFPSVLLHLHSVF